MKEKQPYREGDEAENLEEKTEEKTETEETPSAPKQDQPLTAFLVIIQENGNAEAMIGGDIMEMVQAKRMATHRDIRDASAQLLMDTLVTMLVMGTATETSKFMMKAAEAHMVERVKNQLVRGRQ